MGIEGGHSIEDSIPLLRDYYALGVRYMTLTWSNSNGWADSSGDIDDTIRPAHQGRTHRVRQRRGLRDEPPGHDGRHLPRLRPHLLPHSGHHARPGHRVPLLRARSLRCSAQHDRRHAARRCQLRRAQFQGRRHPGQLLLRLPLAGLPRRAKGHQPEVDKASPGPERQGQGRRQGSHVRRDRQRSSASYADRIPRPPLSVLIDHIDHIAKVAGVDHVGLGSDFDGVERPVARGHRLRPPTCPRSLRR